MSEIINEKYTFEENMINCKLFLIKEEQLLKSALALANGVKLKYSVIDENNTSINENPDSNFAYCKIVNKIQDLEKILKFIEKPIKVFNEIIQYCVKYIQFSIAQIIAKYTQMLVLFVKRITVYIKRKVAEFLKKMLEACTRGLGSATMVIFIQPIILLFQGISILANGILIGTTAVLSALPSLIAVDAEGMCFFMTPKSLQTTKMNVINTNQSIVYRLPEALMQQLQNLLKQFDKLNIPIKISAVAAGAALGALSVRDGKDLNIGCNALKLLDPMTILKAIETLVSLLPLAQPLPKYEKLSFTNIGFLVWLITGFEPAGFQSFGFPV